MCDFTNGRSLEKSDSQDRKAGCWGLGAGMGSWGFMGTVSVGDRWGWLRKVKILNANEPCV